mgnify:CR=1 FL=1
MQKGKGIERKKGHCHVGGGDGGLGRKGEGSKREKEGRFMEENLFREVNSSKM